jgi:hypothetical protein
MLGRRDRGGVRWWDRRGIRVKTKRAQLPTLVARYVDRNLPPGPPPANVRLTQAGVMQLKPGRWLRFEAEQEAATERVEFSWKARFPIAPLVALRVDDWYGAGNGALEVKLFGLPLKRSRGVDVARGEAMRYLAELPWVPHAFVANRELEWREVDGSTVEVATTIVGSRAAVRLHFDDDGDFVAASAQDRPRAVGKAVVPTPFAGEFGDYELFDGIRLPTTAAVRWELPEGPFVYFRARIRSFAVA